MTKNVAQNPQTKIPQRVRRGAIALFYVSVGVLCVLAIWNALAPDGFASIGPALKRVSWVGLVASAGSLIGVYAMVWVMEQVALKDANAPKKARMQLAVPLIVNALATGAGFGIMSGGALRARLYAPAGVKPTTAFFVASCVTLMSVLGGGLVAGLGLVLANVHVMGLAAPIAGLPRIIGAGVLASVIGLMLLGGSQGRTIRVAAHEYQLPPMRGFLWRIGLGAADWLFSALALYVLLPPAVRPPYLDFAATFAAFQLIAMLTGAPGGLGVFEAMMLSFGSGYASPELMAASLICYRITTFVAPVALGLAALAILEALRGKQRRLSAAPAERD